jgi:hypothetical protein
MDDMSNIFSLLTGIASIAGFASAFYFYFQQKKADEVTRGFVRAIKLQAEGVDEQLDHAASIVNTTAFDSLSARVKAARQSSTTLAKTLAEFESTLWPSKDSKR